MPRSNTDKIFVAAKIAESQHCLLVSQSIESKDLEMHAILEVFAFQCDARFGKQKGFVTLSSV